MGCGSGADQGPLISQQNQQRVNLNAAVGNIKNAFSGFTPNWYQGIAKAYQDYALPQLQQQYRSNADQFGFKMSNQGLQRSTQNQAGQQALQQGFDQGKTQIAQQGQGLVQQEQQQVQNQEANLLNMAQTATSPGQVALMAQGQAANIQTPSVFQPIGQFLGSFASQFLGGQQQQLGNQLNSLLSNYFNPISNPTNSYAGAAPPNQ